MTGCIAQRNETYYVRLTYYDKNHKRKDKWVSTGLSVRGAKQKAADMIYILHRVKICSATIFSPFSNEFPYTFREVYQLLF